MELTRELKDKLEKSTSAEEEKKILEEAGVALNDAELDQVAGGGRLFTSSDSDHNQLGIN